MAVSGHRSWAFAGRHLCRVVVVAGLLFLAAACGKDDSVNTRATGSSAPGSTSRPSSTQPATAALEVKETGFRLVPFEHWEGGVSLIDAGYIWGAVIENPNDATALDVTIEATFIRDGTAAKTATFTIDEIPPGSFAWGSRPVIVPGDEVDAITVTLEPARFASEATTTDRLVSPAVVTAADWKGEITVEAIDDPRALYTLIAFYGTDGKLIAVRADPVDPTVLTPGSPVKVFVPARPEGGPQISEVRVFLARLGAPGDLIAPPTTTTTRPG